MARNEQLIRQHKILQILERVRYGKTLQELQADIVEELGLKSLHTRTQNISQPRQHQDSTYCGEADTKASRIMRWYPDSQRITNDRQR